MTRHGPTAPRTTCASPTKRRRRHPFTRAAAVGVSAGVLVSVPVAAAHSEPDGVDDHSGTTPETTASAPSTSGASPSDDSGTGDGGSGTGDGGSGETAPPLDRGEVLRLARQQHGTPYEWGADGPEAFDCSGFTRHVFGRLGHTLPRTAESQYEAVRHVPRSELRTGDLVFSRNEDGEIYHVGIFAGRDRMWAATKPGDIVRTQQIWTDDYLVGRP
jgi:cell wall-associated NlpC family hydrolase